jgi:hypothetical protein
MDFEIAARRLEKDQQSALARARASRNARTTSAKAKREAAAARAKAEKRLEEKKLAEGRNGRVVDRIVRSMNVVERKLGVVSVGDVNITTTDAHVESKPTTAMDTTTTIFKQNPLASGWQLSATSIHGEGDKIALPPSILESLTSGSTSGLDPWGSSGSGRPLAFRIGLLNPAYGGFPSSDKMVALVEKVREDVIASESAALDEQQQTTQNDADEMDASDDEEETSQLHREAYLDELSHRYLSYTHGTVVEFTQEDGCVGLPEPIAQVLLNPNAYSLVGAAKDRRKVDISTTRTVDPAAAAVAADTIDTGVEKDDTDTVNMEVDPPSAVEQMIDDSEKTPGHPAYGLFDIPATSIEITPINALPPGKDCTFTPTSSSIRNGFYALKDVKFVLEQSLMRTRATLSRGDVIRTWRRGVSFDLIVSKVSPHSQLDYGVVSCINTNLNVDIGPPEGEEGDDQKPTSDESKQDVANDTTNQFGQGRLLSEPSAQPVQSTTSQSSTNASLKEIELPPEPAEGVTTGICTIQIRGRGSSNAARRRFDITTATMSDLFAFASHSCGEGVGDVSTFRLVTRFPRRIFRLTSLETAGEGCYDANATLESVGVSEGQELFMVELL